MEEGNIEYLKQHPFYAGNIGKITNQDTVRQMKNMILTSIILCTRATIRGGRPSKPLT